MTNKHSPIPYLIGRSLLALYFLLPGVAKLMSPETQLELMQLHNIPAALPLLYIAGLAQVGGALLLLTNRYVRFTAYGFVLYSLIINILLHDFWNFTGIEGLHEAQNFFKNLGVLAGLLILASTSLKRPLRLSTLLKSDKFLN